MIMFEGDFFYLSTSILMEYCDSVLHIAQNTAINTFF